jgi:hypothetical protein
MKENRNEPKKVSTCFDGLPCAEMMQKIMGEEGIGSLCEKMMRSMLTKNENKDQRKGDEK